MPNKTGDFLPLQLTNIGRDMLTQGRAGHVLTFTKIAIGDGTATGTAVDSLTALKSHKLYLPIAKNETVHAGQMRLQFRVNNKVVTTGFYFREIGLYAKVDNGAEQLYAYTTCGDKARMLYDKTYPIQERVVNIDTVIDNAVNVKVILDWSIVYATKKDIVDAIKPHKELAELDHPDASVTTRKLKDKSVTLPKLADEVTDLLKKTYVKKTGDSMTGNLSLNNSSIGFNNGSGNYDTKIRIASNGNFDIGVTEDSANKNATSQLLLHSQNKPKWYNSANGGKVLATEEYVNTETAKYLPLNGGTMKGDITFKRNQSAIKLDGGTNKIHSIDVGGTNGENLDIGNAKQTSQANLCCYNRPGWYGKDKTNTFKPFMFDDDMVITSGTINHNELLPIPEGFQENDCNWILTVAESHANLNDRNQVVIAGESSFGVNAICKREGRKVIVGTQYSLHSSNTDSYRGYAFKPGTANYVCICRRRF
jgi:hypothetical protein|nr:MAG TPA: tail-collar fiber protein [Caudoviricetes sp.]